MSKKSLGNKFVPQYVKNYFERPWFKRDLIEYFEYVIYEDMSKNPKEYFKEKKVINFYIIHHVSRGDPLEGNYKDYHTIKTQDFKDYPTVEKDKTLSSVIYNIKRDDIFIEKKVIKKHFCK